MTATQMATVYGLKSPQAFNKLMVKCGVLKHNDNGYCLADNLQGQGLVAAIDHYYFLPSGFKASKKQAVWTEKGQAFVRHRLGRIGIVPVGEQIDIFTTN